MARYIDADALMEKCFARLRDGGVLYRISPQEINEAPTADVVPRERYNRAMDCLKAVLEERAEDKVELAREIFEEIENNYADFLFDGFRNIVVLTEKDFAELKQKYTEDSP